MRAKLSPQPPKRTLTDRLLDDFQDRLAISSVPATSGTARRMLNPVAFGFASTMIGHCLR